MHNKAYISYESDLMQNQPLGLDCEDDQPVLMHDTIKRTTESRNKVLQITSEPK